MRAASLCTSLVALLTICPATTRALHRVQNLTVSSRPLQPGPCDDAATTDAIAGGREIEVWAERPQARKRDDRRVGAPSAKAQERAARDQAEAIFNEAQRSHEAGDLSSAIQKYSAALEIIPDFMEVLYQRGMAYFALKKHELALVDLGRVTEIEKELIPADPKRAEASLRSFFARAHSAMAEMQSSTGAPQAADVNFRRALDLDRTLIRPRLLWASSLIDRGSYAEAEALLQEALDQKITSADLFTLLGYAQELNKRTDEAVESYSRAIEMDAAALTARQHRAGLWAAKERWERAAEDLAVVMRIRPTAETASALGRLWERAKMPDRALLAYREATKLDPTHLEAQLRLLERLIAQGDKEETARTADFIAQRAPNRADVLGRLGQLLAESDPQRSADAYTRAASLEPQNVTYQVGRGAALVKLRKMPEAIAVLSAALKLSPESYIARANLATALFEQKNYGAAANEFEWIVQHRPETTVAYYFLGVCYDKLQMYQRALQRFEQFLSLGDPERSRAEMDSVRYHLPALRRLVEQGKGKSAKRKG